MTVIRRVPENGNEFEERESLTPRVTRRGSKRVMITRVKAALNGGRPAPAPSTPEQMATEARNAIAAGAWVLRSRGLSSGQNR